MTDAPKALSSRVAWIVALALVYAAAGRLGLLVEPVSGFATLVWPPSGIALAALSLRGRWLWPGVALGALVANVWTGAPVLVALGIAGGNTVAALVACEGLRRAAFDPRVARVRDVLALIVAALLSTLASAAIGVASLRAGGLAGDADVGAALRAWWLGDAMGDLVVAPLVLAWIAPSSHAPSERSPLRGAEALANALVTLGAAATVFGGVLGRAHEARSMYLLFPPLVWAAVRFGRRGAASAVAAVSLVAVLGTLAGHGPFTRDGAPSLLELQSFMAVVAVVSLVLGAAIAERDHAQTVALDAKRAREDFLAIASHELRTPLSTLVLIVGTLKRRLSPDESHSPLGEGLTQAERQTDRLGQIIGHLGDASRAGRGILELDTKTVDLSEIVREVLERSAPQAERVRSELSSSLPGPVLGEWDARRVEQVVTNLVGNALRHAPGAAIDVTLTANEADAILEVRDRGAGIAPERRDALFVRYERGGAKREHGGFGLGLYVAQAAVDAHGGSIRVEPASGGGTRFVVRLPRRRAKALIAR